MEQNVLRSILPLRVQQLLEVIIAKQKLGVEEAMRYLYTSEVYKHLTSGVLYWTYSTASLYDLLKKEKRRQRRNEVVAHSPQLLLFYSFCLENYKEAKQIASEEALSVFVRYQVFHYLASVYDTLHTQGQAYILAEIDDYITHKKKSNGTIPRVDAKSKKAKP
jgi:hypothetical protein